MKSIFKSTNKRLADMRERSDRGAALVTVIIAVSFISILATALLCITASNVLAKGADRRVQKSFYDGERGMEEVKAGIVSIASLAYQDAYNESIKLIGAYYTKDTTPGDNPFSSSATAEFFKDYFLAAFEEEWNFACATCGWSDATRNALTVDQVKFYKQQKPTAAQAEALMHSFMSSNSDRLWIDTSNPKNGQVIRRDAVPGTNPDGSVMVDSAGDVVYIADSYEKICGIKLAYTDSNQYTTKISTDFLINVPKLSFDAAGGSGSALSDKVEDCVQYSGWRKE